MILPKKESQNKFVRNLDKFTIYHFPCGFLQTNNFHNTNVSITKSIWAKSLKHVQKSFNSFWIIQLQDFHQLLSLSPTLLARTVYKQLQLYLHLDICNYRYQTYADNFQQICNFNWPPAKLSRIVNQSIPFFSFCRRILSKWNFIFFFWHLLERSERTE